MAQVGAIREMSRFAWDIPGFENIIKQERFSIYSSYFQFKGITWRLNLFRYNTENVHIRLCRENSDGESRKPCTQSYSLYIHKYDGNVYWSKCVLKEEFWDDRPSSIISTMTDYEFVMNKDRIAPKGVLSFYLNFDSEPILRQPVFPSIKVTDRVLKDLLLTGEKSDVKLNVKGKEFRVHKRILSERSPVFSSMFQHDVVGRSNDVINIPDCDPDRFHDFLHFLYTGDIDTFSANSVVQVFDIAEKYCVNELVEICVKYMVSNLSVETFCDFVTFALRHNNLHFMESASAFFTSNMKQIVATEKWKLFIAKKSNAD